MASKKFTVDMARAAGRYAAAEGEELLKGTAATYIGCKQSLLTPDKRADLWDAFVQGFHQISPDAPIGRRGPRSPYTVEMMFDAGQRAARDGKHLNKATAAKYVGCAPCYFNPALGREQMWDAFVRGYRTIKPQPQKKESITKYVPLADCPGPCTQQWPEDQLIADSNLPRALCPECYDLYQQRVALDERWKMEVLR